MRAYRDTYKKARQKRIAKKYRKTAQFWIKYLIAQERLHILHYAVHRINFELQEQS